MQAFAAHLCLTLGGRVFCVEEYLSVDGDGAPVGLFQEIETTEHGGLAAAGGANDGQCLSLFQGKADVFEHLGGTKALFDISHF